jgi:eukaryotic-like serine/threonine-protein kinase
MVDNALSGRTLGQFVLCEQIGKGGFGTVYRCEQPQLQRQAVIKVLHEDRRASDVGQSRFLREARLASRLDHHYAAHIYDSGAEHDGVLWIAMELVAGITLEKWLQTHGPMAADQFVPFFEKVAEVVQAAHDRGIVHRDLKPSNIMVVESGGSLIPKLLDLGIAKLSADFAAPSTGWPEGSLGENHEGANGAPATERPLTRSGAGFGSAEYMSPEQWTHPAAVGPGSDIYSLGVVVYRALTGRVPFAADTRDECCRLHCHAEVPSLGHAVSPGFEQAVRRALAKYPEARHASVLELASELRTVLQTSEREQLRASAQQWETGARAPGLLWGVDMLERFEQWTRRAPWPALGDVELSFIAASQRRARRSTWGRRVLVALAVTVVLGVLGGFLLYASMKARHETLRHAQELAQEHAQAAERLITQLEVEQGRQALRDDMAEARVHLTEAYKRGDHSPGVKFMLARSLQPQLAEQARFASTTGRMWSAAFAPDGKTIVTTDDQSAQVWDATSYRRLFTVTHGDTVYDALYSPDGRQLVTAGGDGTVGVWDAANGSLVRTLSSDGRKLRYDLLAASPDGKLIAAIDVKGEAVHVWDAGTGVPRADLPADASGFPGVAFSADSRWLVATGGDEVRVFDVQTWSKVLTVPHVRRMDLDPTGPRLVTGSLGGDSSIWEIPSGVRIRHLREIGESIDRVAFSPDGALVATATADGAEQVWSASTGALQSQFNARRSKILAVEFDRTSRLLLSAGADGTVVVADTALGMPISVLEGPQGIVRVAHFEPSSRRVVAASWDGTARVWSAAAPYLRWGSAPIGDDCGGNGAEPDRRFVAIDCGGQTHVWDTAHDQLVTLLPSVTRVNRDWSSASPVVAPAGDLAAIARDDTVELYDLPSGRLIRVIHHRAAVTAVAFAAARRVLVSGDTGGGLLVTREGYEPVALPSSSRGIDAAGFLADGRVMAVDASRRLRVYAPGTWAVLADLELPTRVVSLRPSLDGLRLITLPSTHVPSYVGKAASPILWDLRRYRAIASLTGHRGQVFSARFVAGDHEIVTAGGDGTAGLWDGWTGHRLQTYRGSLRFLADAMLTPDGAMVIGGGGDGVVRFWDTASGRPLWGIVAYRSPVMGIHWEGDSLLTRGLHGEISRWVFPAPEQVIEADTKLALSCQHEQAHPPEACTSRALTSIELAAAAGGGGGPTDNDTQCPAVPAVATGAAPCTNPGG